MKRRIFIRNATLTGLGVGLAGIHGCINSNQKAKETVNTELFFKLSLGQWSIHRKIGEEGLDPYLFASKASEWGFEGLEYVNHLFQQKMSGFSSVSAGIQNLVSELNKRSQDEGMKNLVMMVDLPPGQGDMAIKDKSKRSAAVERHYPWVDATAGLGCHSMRVNMFGELEPTLWKETSIDALKQLAEYASSQKVNILIENHGYLTSNAALVMEVMEAVNKDNCGTLPDFGNFCLRRENNERRAAPCVEEYDKYKGVKELMPLAKAVSAKTYDFDEEGNETTIAYDRMLRIVKEAGYNGYIGVEYEGSRLSEEEGILASKNLLIKVGKQLASI